MKNQCHKKNKAFEKRVLTTLENILPKITKIKVHNELDYYGLSSYISKKLQLKSKPISTEVGFRHAWMHGILKYPEEITMGVSNLIQLVGTKKEVQFLSDNHIYNAKAVGVPYIYLDNNDFKKIKRFKNSLLVMPPHSLPKSNHYWDEDDYIKSILTISHQFRIIIFCIHQSCVKQNLWIKTLKKYKIPWIFGADAEDKNSLLRMGNIFHSFEYMTTNAFGSHIAYASYSGCKTSIFGPYFQHNKDNFRNIDHYNKFPFLLDQLLYINSEKYIRRNFPQFFQSPKKATQKKAWAAKALGKENKVSYQKLAELLGWFHNGQLNFYLNNKIFFSKKFNVFYSLIEQLRKENKRYVIYGTGTIGKTITALMNENIVAYVDQKSDLITKKTKKGETYSPENLINLRYDYIIITVIGREYGIKSYLTQQLEIDKNKIIEIDI